VISAHMNITECGNKPLSVSDAQRLVGKEKNEAVDFLAITLLIQKTFFLGLLPRNWLEKPKREDSLSRIIAETPTASFSYFHIEAENLQNRRRKSAIRLQTRTREATLLLSWNSFPLAYLRDVFPLKRIEQQNQHPKLNGFPPMPQ
jgi:hypothetical protein